MNQTDKIKYFQRKGLSYSETALKLNLKVDSVKSFYFRHPADNTCLCCGEVVVIVYRSPTANVLLG